jgi:hypothetical protein
VGEAKWGVLERFRLFPGRGAAPGRSDLLRRAVEGRVALLRAGAHMLGPFRVVDEAGEWWLLAWKFPDRSAAEGLRRLHEDPDWLRSVETRVEEGPEGDLADGLPGG